MANATAITLRTLSPNTVLTQPTADVLDTGTDPVDLTFAPDGDLHNILLEFINTAAAADTMTVKVNAGAMPPAMENSYGDLSVTVAQNAVRYLVLDSSRFMQADGKIKITFTPANTKTQTMTVRAYKLPK